MAKEEEIFLKNEHVEKILTPHPLSFMGLQSLWLFILLWGVLLWWVSIFSQYASIFSNQLIFLGTWWGVTVLAGVIASLVAIRWRILFFYVGILLLGTIILWQTGWINDIGTVKTFVLVYSIAISALSALAVFAYVKSHRYIITDLRIIFKGGIIKKRERTLRYDKITDVDGEQGILGQIFGFGTIIPITQSGFGLGSDQTFAAGGVEAQGKKIGIFGFAGGSKEVKTPRTRSYYELHGVYPYREIRKLVEELIQGNVITPYQKEQVELQREQVELQKEMKEFLEKQSLLKDDE
ncbi:MAG: PH domain-containing protein [Thermoplasmata archaeon]|nr:PH domain-containing protein [Thermoplasmata archaeon]